MDRISELREELEQKLSQTTDLISIDKVRVDFLGKKGRITALLKGMKDLSNEEKKTFGAKVNKLKESAAKRIDEKIEDLRRAEVEREIAAMPKFDITAPANLERGSYHPITLVQRQCEAIFKSMGFTVEDYPEVVTDYECFESVNIPKHHPARDMQDTFWLKNQLILRTHTSANQVRTLERFGAPIRAIFPGRCFRYESIDPSHENTFYQCEGLVVDKDISVANLIAVMKTILSQVFRRDVRVRLRPGYFPFVEPGFELDLNCLFCGGKGCPTCGDGWIELIPCGLVHPQVLRFGGVDPREYSGFAFGVGLTRLAMMKYGIRDIRYLNCGDLRVNEQFSVLM